MMISETSGWQRTRVLGAAAVITALLTACGSKPPVAADTTPVNTGLDQLSQAQLADAQARQAALADLAERSAVDLERILANQQQAAAAPPPQNAAVAGLSAPSVPLPQPPAAHDPATSQPVQQAAAPAQPSGPDALQVAAAANGIDPAVLAAAIAAAQQAQQTSDRSPSEKIPQLAADLGTLIRQRAETGPSPLADYLMLASLETAQPGLLGEGGTLSGNVSARLSSPELQLLTAFRTFIAALGPGAAGAADPVATAGRLAEAFGPVTAVLPLRVSDARLCTRVMGFGAFAPFPSNVFQAGRPQPAIVYVEIDHFTHRPAKSSDPGVSDVPTFNTPELWAVEVSQELNLHQDSDGSLQWRQAPQVVIEASRRQRRDFYLIQQIELPPTLTVGNYSLKITVRDRINDAVAEAVIPIQIVADANLASGQN
ncbi:MAG: hypothetical protein IT436_02870 [Phycisphaerales bacterium]|nr:hypothetical protein [Phycisphaerales bacterium]